LATAVLGACISGAGASEAQRVRNEEYGFSVAFPAGLRVCTAVSGDHPHGFFVRLNGDQGECGGAAAKSDVSVIGVYAYYNSTFETSPEEELAGLCRESGNDDKSGKLKSLGFAGRHSARCQVQHADGSIDIYVVTQAGQWPGAQESPELKTPYINYTASLHTTHSRMADDLKTFSGVLKSVRIYQK
jgi:hypothetical protein